METKQKQNQELNLRLQSLSEARERIERIHAELERIQSTSSDPPPQLQALKRRLQDGTVLQHVKYWARMLDKHQKAQSVLELFEEERVAYESFIATYIESQNLVQSIETRAAVEILYRATRSRGGNRR